MDQHHTGCWQAPAPPGEQSSSDPWIYRLFDMLQIPPGDRARQYPNVARLLDERWRHSMASTASTPTTPLSSKRSTQASFASSCTSCSSVSSNTPGLTAPSLPTVTEETESARASTVVPDPTPSTSNNALHRKLQKRLKLGSARSSSVSTASTPGADSEASATLTNKSRCRWCPWCNQWIKRPHDFKQHVVNYCCNVNIFVCRNPECRNLTYQGKLARDHCRESEHVACRHSGYSKMVLQGRRKHFGCGYCSLYFDNLDKFIDHFNQTCRPDRVTGRYHKSRQIRALLQQPEMLPVVQALCLRFRGDAGAYLGLWWTWKTHKMNSVIRKLEYGPQDQVDNRNPGIPREQLHEFIRDLIEPSGHSQRAIDIVLDPTPTRNASFSSYDQDPPPLPPEDHQGAIEDHTQFADFDNNDVRPGLGHMSGHPADATLLSKVTDYYRMPEFGTQPQSTGQLNDALAGQPHFPETELAMDDTEFYFQWNDLMVDDSNEPPADNQWVDHELGHYTYQGMYEQNGHYMAESGPSSYQGTAWHGGSGGYR